MFHRSMSATHVAKTERVADLHLDAEPQGPALVVRGSKLLLANNAKAVS